jgi:hypothetical protein
VLGREIRHQGESKKEEDREMCIMRVLRFVIVLSLYWGNHINATKMGWACVTHGEEEPCVWGFG